MREKPEPLAVSEATNQCWSMDFMYDQLSDGRSVRVFNLIDDFNREALSVEIDLSLPAERVVRALDQVIEWRGKPLAIRSDNGPEYISAKLAGWAEKRGIRLEYFNRATRSRMPTSSATTARYVMTGWDITCLSR